MFRDLAQQPEPGNWEQLYSVNQHDFLPYFPRAAVISQWEREVKTKEI